MLCIFYYHSTNMYNQNMFACTRTSAKSYRRILPQRQSDTLDLKKKQNLYKDVKEFLKSPSENENFYYIIRHCVLHTSYDQSCILLTETYKCRSILKLLQDRNWFENQVSSTMLSRKTFGPEFLITEILLSFYSPRSYVTLLSTHTNFTIDVKYC